MAAASSECEMRVPCISDSVMIHTLPQCKGRQHGGCVRRARGECRVRVRGLETTQSALEAAVQQIGIYKITAKEKAKCE